VVEEAAETFQGLRAEAWVRRTAAARDRAGAAVGAPAEG